MWILWGFAGVIGSVLLAILIAFGGEWISWYIAILCILCSVYKLFFSRTVTMASRYRLLAKTYGVSEWQSVTEFTEDEIILSDHTTVIKFRYDSIKCLREKKNLITIGLDSHVLIFLFKDAFVDTTWEECKAFLATKMAK